MQISRNGWGELMELQLISTLFSIEKSSIQISVTR